MAVHIVKVELRCTTEVDGVQYVMMGGMMYMLAWYVCNWDLDHQEN